MSLKCISTSRTHLSAWQKCVASEREWRGVCSAPGLGTDVSASCHLYPDIYWDVHHPTWNLVAREMARINHGLSGLLYRDFAMVRTHGGAHTGFSELISQHPPQTILSPWGHPVSPFGLFFIPGKTWSKSFQHLAHTVPWQTSLCWSTSAMKLMLGGCGDGEGTNLICTLVPRIQIEGNERVRNVYRFRVWRVRLGRWHSLKHVPGNQEALVWCLEPMFQETKNNGTQLCIFLLILTF